jgi:hypothetical protein
MTERQLNALLDYIDARIEQKLVERERLARGILTSDFHAKFHSDVALSLLTDACGIERTGA